MSRRSRRATEPVSSSASMTTRPPTMCRPPLNRSSAVTSALRSEVLLHSTRDSSSLRSEEHTSELQSRQYLVCRLLLEKNSNTLPAPLFTFSAYLVVLMRPEPHRCAGSFLSLSSLFVPCFLLVFRALPFSYCLRSRPPF